MPGIEGRVHIALTKHVSAMIELPDIVDIAVRYRTSVEQKAGTMILVDGRLDSGEPRWTTSLRDLTIEKESVADCKILPSPGEMTVGG